MQILKNLRPFFSISKPLLFSHKTPVTIHTIYFSTKELSSSSSQGGDSEWNDAWETAWLPDDNGKLSSTNNADVTFPSSVDVTPTPPADLDSDTKAFVAEMDERWNERKGLSKRKLSASEVNNSTGKSNKKEGDEYRIRKQRIHAGLWKKEIEKMEEARVGSGSCGDDIDKLLDSCSEIFESGNVDLNDSKASGAPELKSKPDGWETTTKNKDGNIWEISQREEDILLQEFERRIAFSKFQIASFIKSHIFSRRRPIDGWKYMIEELGPNARKGKGSVQRLPSLSDSSTQPFTEEIQPNAIPSKLSSHRGR